MVERLAEWSGAARVRAWQGAALVAAVVLAMVGPGLDRVRAETYTVESGDTLSEIARDHGVSVDDLMERNGISDPHRIRVGQRLELGGSASTTYVVRSGDVLGIIARDHGVSLQALIEANGITNPNRIRVGDQLLIPGGAAPVVSRSLPRQVRNDPERLALVPIFERWANANGIDPALLMAVAWQESGWNNEAVSSAGAIGIGQLLPSTAEWMAEDFIGVPGLDPTEPEDNIRLSARYLRYLIRLTGSEEVAVASYFQGPRSVRDEGMIGFTEQYVANVFALRGSFE